MKTTQRIDLDLYNAQTFNEKIQWLKLYDSTPIKTRLADKYLVRDWVKEKIGEEYLIPLLGVYDKFEDINFNKLPNQFVIKCNHGSGWNIIVKDKTQLDLTEAKNKLNGWMNENFAFKAGYELHYRDIKPKIVIEKYIDEIGTALYDYRFFCFNGKVEQIWLDVYSGTPNHKRKIYDRNWQELNIIVKWPRLETVVPKPHNLKEMINLAETMSKGFALVRVDFYDVNDKIYFGEMTFTSMSGTGIFEPAVEDLKLGKKIKLPKLAYDIDTGQYYKAPRRSRLKTGLFFPYYLLRWLKQKINSFNKQITEIKQRLQIMRIDVKNFGTSDNNIVVVGKNIITSQPAWFTDKQGTGTIVESSDLKQKLTINIVKDGILRLIFRGQDKKNSKGVRKKVWIDYQSIKIDGKEILSSPVKTWHDEPYRYEMSVKDGQIVNVEIKQIPHQYDQNELKWLIKLFNPNLPDLDKVSKIVHRKFKYRGGLFYQKQTKEHKKIYICGIQVYNARMKGTPMNEKTVESSLLQRIMQKAKSLNPSSKEIEQTLQEMRIDVKNYGASDNDIVVTGKNIKTNKPKWFINEKGVGAVIETSNSRQKLSIKIIKDGKLQFSFRGQDKKNSKGVRMPVWIDYKSIKIDGKEILSSPIKTWHDEPYRYEMAVKDGQTIGVEIKQTSHEYTKAELNALINEMYPNLKDLENISNKVYRKFKHNKGLGYLLFHKKKTDTDPSFESRFAELSSKIKKMQSDMEVQQKELLQKVNEQMTSQINTKLEKVLSQMSKEIEKIQTDVKGLQTELMQKIDEQQSVINNLQAWQTEQSQKTTSKSARIIKFKRSL